MTFENEREIQIHVANHMIGKSSSTRAGATPQRLEFAVPIIISLAFRAKDGVIAAVSETFQIGVKTSELEHFLHLSFLVAAPLTLQSNL